MQLCHSDRRKMVSLAILICQLPVSFWTLHWPIVPLLRACTSHYSSFYGLFVFSCIDLLKLFISPALKHPPPPPHTPQLWERPVDRAGGGGPSPPGNLGFLRNVLMRRQAASPRFLLWAFWGHSLVQPPHQEGSSFRERVPRKKKGWAGGFADPQSCLQNTV